MSSESKSSPSSCESIPLSESLASAKNSGPTRNCACWSSVPKFTNPYFPFDGREAASRADKFFILVGSGRPRAL